ncbi:MAG: hypothetical protein JXB44_11245 [Calditrichaceae bacterium]|nr:hypothetical protein [Calditrichaceae bacterium]RQV93902.1 MAG: hypothetical protein EH224_11800 [Calditrichota bacterium]
MNYLKIIILISVLISIQFLHASGIKAELIKVSGDVKVRFGLNEEWQKAESGQILDEFDSILTGQDGRATLYVKNGVGFTIKNRTFLDIADLRTIRKDELFLVMMSKKVEKLEPVNNKTIKIGNVSVIHGSEKQPAQGTDDAGVEDWSILEINGAKALYDYGYYTNAAVKLCKIRDKYSDDQDCGEADYWLGKSLEAVNYTGHAIDAYQKALDEFKRSKCRGRTNVEWVNDSKQRLTELKNKGKNK